MRLIAAALALSCALPAAAERHPAQALARPAQALDPSPEPTRLIALQVVILRGAPWTYDAVERRVAKAREIVARCGVRLDATITEQSSPSGSADVLYEPARAEEPDGMGWLARALGRPKPTLFYIGVFSDNEAQSGTSRPPFQSSGKAEADTAWIPFSALGELERPYQIDAHELVHVLADVGHVAAASCAPRARKDDPVDPACADGGLMAGNPRIRSHRIPPELCERIKARPYAKALSR